MSYDSKKGFYKIHCIVYTNLIYLKFSPSGFYNNYLVSYLYFSCSTYMYTVFRIGVFMVDTSSFKTIFNCI